MERYRLPLVLTFTPVASAAHAAGIAAADVVPFAWVADVVRDETRYRAALKSAKRAGSITAADAARRLAESNGRVCDAVCAAADGFDAEPVVAIERGNACNAPTLQAAGISYVRPLATVAGGVVASHNGRATVAFDSITDAVAHAAGAVRRPILPGETLPPVAPNHGDAAPELPSLAAAFGAANDQLRAIGDRATASAFARMASMRAAIDAELARGY